MGGSLRGWIVSPAMSVLAEIRARGISIRAEGDRLRFGPPERFTPDLFDRMRKHKAELVAILTGDAPADPELPSWADPGSPTVMASRGEARRLGVLNARPTAVPAYRWAEGDALAGLPEPIQGLVCPRDGWTPESWASCLTIRADRCDDRHTGVAERYRLAARILRGEV